jgi:hypothetical protein
MPDAGARNCFSYCASVIGLILRDGGNVSFWHNADNLLAAIVVRLHGQNGYWPVTADAVDRPATRFCLIISIATMMSAYGPKRTSLVAQHTSAFGGKADMTFYSANVRL